MDLISREEAINALGNAGLINYAATGSSNGLIHAMNVIKALPSAQSQRMRGRWIESDTYGFVCSVCRSGYKMQPTIMGEPMFEFCPICGAQMEGGEQE